MTMAFDKAKYIKKFQKDHYDRLYVQVPSGAKDDLQAYAKANDLSLNQLILKALERQYLFDFSKYKQNDEAP